MANTAQCHLCVAIVRLHITTMQYLKLPSMENLLQANNNICLLRMEVSEKWSVQFQFKIRGTYPLLIYFLILFHFILLFLRCFLALSSVRQVICPSVVICRASAKIQYVQQLCTKKHRNSHLFAFLVFHFIKTYRKMASRYANCNGKRFRQLSRSKIYPNVVIAKFHHCHCVVRRLSLCHLWRECIATKWLKLKSRGFHWCMYSSYVMV